MTELASATLTPFDEQGNKVVDADKVIFDFNPETLTIKVTNTLEQDKAQKNLPRRQFITATSSTLSFDAVFDSTHPSRQGGALGDTPERLDVRKRTEKIARLLYADENAKKPAPRRVRFSWGSIVFEGVMDTYSEVLEYFSPEGIPLRSKVSVSIKEQKFEYKIEEKRKQLAQGNPTGGPGGVGPGATGDGGPFGFSFGASLDASFGIEASLSVGLDVGVSAGLDLGVGVDLGFSAGASMGLSVDAAVEVFGGAAVSAAAGENVDLSKSARGDARAPAGPLVKGNQANQVPWAPAGPAVGSRAAAIAAIVQEKRVLGPPPDRAPPGGSFTATRVEPKAAEAPLPVRGSPPRIATTVGSAGAGVVFGKARSHPAERATYSGTRPRWEELGPAPSGAATSADRPCCAACAKAAWTRPTAPCRTCGGK